MNGKKFAGVKLYYKIGDVLKLLTHEEILQMLQDVFDYAETGIEPEYSDPDMALTWLAIKPYIEVVYEGDEED